MDEFVLFSSTKWERGRELLARHKDKVVSIRPAGSLTIVQIPVRQLSDVPPAKQKMMRIGDNREKAHSCNELNALSKFRFTGFKKKQKKLIINYKIYCRIT